METSSQLTASSARQSGLYGSCPIRGNRCDIPESLWDRRVALRADRAIEQSLPLEGLLENVGLNDRPNRLN